MKRIKLAVLLAGLATLAGCSNDTNVPAETTNRATPAVETPSGIPEPMAEKRPQELTIHGDTRVDDFYWLRDDDRADPEMLAYLEKENAWFEQEMAHTKPLQEALYEEMTGRLDPDESSVPYLDGGYWYYERYVPGHDYAVFARREGTMQAPEEVLVDGNARAEGHGFYDLSNAEVSDDHRYVAIAEDTMGRRINEVRILDTQAGEYLPEVIENASSSLAWSADGRFLFYLDKHPETLLAYRVMRHELGTSPDDDELVYEETDNTFYNALYRSRSGDWIVLVHSATDTTEYQLLDAREPGGRFQVFLPREKGHEYGIDHAGEHFWVKSNHGATNFAVFRTTLENSINPDAWEAVIPGRDDALVESIQAFDDWLVVGERMDGLRQVRVLSHDGTVDRYLSAEEDNYVMWPGYNVSTHTRVLRYGYSSLVTPDQTWEVDLASGETTLLKAQRVPGYDSSQYRTGRRFITARDGTRVPVSLAWHRDTPLDGSAPALVYGYGSYGASMDPWFRNAVVSLLDRGFVYAIAHIRGGQEMGRSWYEQGKLMNKRNTFNDFIDVTRGLQAGDVIDPERTYAMGGSAGGLLMGAVINQAPSLYHGVVAAVPFVDVVTTMLDDSIPLTTGEYDEWGNPNEPEAYEYMLTYSPYDNVGEQDYPNLMVVTGLHDSQVQYFEPAKWVARLRDRRTDDNRLLFRTNMEAGHGGSSGRYRRYEEIAEEYAFIIDLAQPGR
ncbi:S9 family peptidase [Marinihelvus fidelis]|uniref:S9 family peptidase n=1 Tax=Marinihelvus fidelis TaxID=2613842 RepID=A0A5N0T933_9GAMM|nr:S9 family peptidase [Marinihelvus fidelis]KAA9129809.1 S9 family peptidase [Marinihelvus fidelis]